MLKFLIPVLGLVLAGMWLPGGAHAIPPSVMEPYRAYMAAIEADDLEAAAPHAEEAWQAGVAAGIDDDTLAALAENRAQIYADVRDFPRGALAWAELAELLREQGADPDQQARAAMSAALLFAASDNKADALAYSERVIAFNPQGAESELLFLALRLKADIEWTEGRLQPASLAAQQALAVREQLGPIADPQTMTTAIIAAVGSLMDRNEVDGAFYIALAEEIGLAIPASRDDRVMLEGWSTYLRMQLNEQQRGELFERTLDSALFGLEVAEGVDGSGQADELDGRDVVDARPERRDPPRYPPSMAQRGLEGFALMMFDVSAQGQPENIRTMLSIPHPQFGQTSAEAVRRWRYTPRTVDGEPVRREGVVTHFIYSLR